MLGGERLLIGARSPDFQNRNIIIPQIGVFNWPEIKVSDAFRIAAAEDIALLSNPGPEDQDKTRIE